MTRTYDRRTLLRTVGAVGIAATVAGCSGDGGDGGGDGGATGGDGGSNSTPSDDGDSDWTQTSTVEMTDELKYAPKRIQVSTGTTVTWKNTGSLRHSITAYEDELPDGAAYFASGGADSEEAANTSYPDEGAVAAGNSSEHTFETAGTYKYYCIPHEMNGMVGYVKVV